MGKRSDANGGGAQGLNKSRDPSMPSDRRPESLRALCLLPRGSGFASRHDAASASVQGLSYSIASDDERPGCARLYIESSLYDIHGQAMTVPVMEFRFSVHAPCPARGGGQDGAAIRDLKIMSRPLECDSDTGIRAISVALFFIHQIDAGRVPDWEYLLEFHKLTTGRRLGLRPYERRNAARDDIDG